MNDIDLVIVGAGPAGIAAAIWARSLELCAVVLDTGVEPGGQLLRIYNRIADYPGVEAPNGEDLARRFRDHLDHVGGSVRAGVTVTGIDTTCLAAVMSDGGRIEAGALLLATGVRRRSLGVPGEAEFVGRGVSPSASRYGPQYSGARVLVVGGGDAAFEEALILACECDRVTLVHRTDLFRAREDFIRAVAAHPRIDVITNATLEAIEGETAVECAKLAGPGGPTTLDVSGVFICAGIVPNTEMVHGCVALDESGFVLADSRQRTSGRGIYAAGDVCSGSSLTIAAACGQGAAAAKDVQRALARDAGSTSW